MDFWQSIDSVELWQFFAATFIVYPKVALFVFIGSRLAALSDGEQRKQMDTCMFALLRHIISSLGVTLQRRKS